VDLHARFTEVVIERVIGAGIKDHHVRLEASLVHVLEEQIELAFASAEAELTDEVDDAERLHGVLKSFNHDPQRSGAGGHKGHEENQ
jgi:hypothetical protein